MGFWGGLSPSFSSEGLGGAFPLLFLRKTDRRGKFSKLFCGIRGGGPKSAVRLLFGTGRLLWLPMLNEPLPLPSQEEAFMNSA